MSDDCYRVEDLGQVIAAIRRGQRPAHLETCPRCRSLVASYQAFLDPPDLPTSAELEDVARRVRIPVAAGAASAPEEARPGVVQRLMRHFELPWLRPVAAVGLVGLAVIVYLGVRPDGIFRSPSHVLRGGAPTAGAVLQPLPPQAAADGSVILAWRAVPEAQVYVAIFYRPDLSEIARRGSVGDTTLTLGPEELAPLRAGEPLYWQVMAVRSGAEFARSTPRELVLP